MWMHVTEGFLSLHRKKIIDKIAKTLIILRWSRNQIFATPQQYITPKFTISNLWKAPKKTLRNSKATCTKMSQEYEQAIYRRGNTND